MKNVNQLCVSIHITVLTRCSSILFSGKFTSWVKILKDMGHHPNRLTFLVELHKSLYIQNYPPVSPMWDYLFDPNPNNPLLNKESTPVSSTFFTSNSSPREAGTPIAKEYHCQISRESKCFIRAHYYAFLSQIGEINNIEHHPNIQLSASHDSDTNWRTWCAIPKDYSSR